VETDGLEAAINYITKAMNPEIESEGDTSQTQQQIQVKDSDLTQLMEMGFDQEQAVSALQIGVCFVCFFVCTMFLFLFIVVEWRC